MSASVDPSDPGIVPPGLVLPPALAGLAQANGLGELRLMYQPDQNTLFRTQATKDRRIIVFAQGFMHAAGPNAADVYRWDWIAEVYQNIVDHYQNGRYQYTTVQFTITLVDGRKVKIDGVFRGARKLGAHINDAVSNTLLPKANAALDQGAALPFGQFQLSAQFLAHQRRGGLPWPQILAVSLTRGHIHVFEVGRKKSSYNVDCSLVPNLPLFLHLTKRYTSRGLAARQQMQAPPGYPQQPVQQWNPWQGR